MNQEIIGIVIGGVLPAVLLGIFATLQKASSQAGVSTALLLVFIACGTALVGGILLIATPSGAGKPTTQGILFALATGVVWSGATALVFIGISRFHIPISKLVPIFNMNTLVAVILGLLLFREGHSLNIVKLFVGAVCVIIGGILVAGA